MEMGHETSMAHECWDFDVNSLPGACNNYNFLLIQLRITDGMGIRICPLLLPYKWVVFDAASDFCNL